MKNRNVGFLVAGISLSLMVIIFIFNQGLRKVVSQACSHGSSCSMYSTISAQTWMSLSIAAVILIIGLFLIFSRENEKIVVKMLKKKKKKIDTSGLNETEIKAVKLIQEENAIFQSSLMEKLGIGKVGITRLLDKLEAKQIIERKRRGMNNVVVLRQ